MIEPRKLISLFLLVCLNLTPASASLREIKNEKLQQKSARLSLTANENGVCDHRLVSVNINWWDNFSDPLVKDYIYKAIERNHNLKKAALKSEEYRQMVKSTLSGQLPMLSLAPAFFRIKTAGGNEIGDLTFNTSRTNVYNIPLFAAYEADVFLKNYDKTKSSKKQQEAAEYEEKAAYISVAADVASLYINIIKLDKIIETQEKIVQVREKIMDLTKERNKIGLASVYDVTNTDKLHTIALIELSSFKRERAIYLHRLAVYIDESPSSAQCLKRNSFDDLEYKGEIPKFISSDVALMRPDLMKAEAELQKAKIDVRIARKEFLPSIPVFGSAGYNSTTLSGLFDWQSIAAFVGVLAIQKLYTGGRLTANLRIKKIQFEELFENYKQADLTALQEINDALCMIKYDTEKDNNNLKKYKLEAKNFNLINERFKAGIMSYLQMIQYQENLLVLQSERDNSKAQRLVDYITLYKASGTKL